MSRLIFITGTDTGVGKTVVTSLLLAHLRATGQHALAIKPFCSGNRKDPMILRALQERELALEEINPFFFPEPVAPLVAMRKRRHKIALDQVLHHISWVAGRCDCLLIEGAGGVLVPLGEGYTILDMIKSLQCETLIISANRLGTLNHTLLTVEMLQRAGQHKLQIVLKGVQHRDRSGASNALVLSELLRPTPLFQLPWLSGRLDRIGPVRRHAARLKRRLAELVSP